MRFVVVSQFTPRGSVSLLRLKSFLCCKVLYAGKNHTLERSRRFVTRLFARAPTRIIRPSTAIIQLIWENSYVSFRTGGAGHRSVARHRTHLRPAPRQRRSGGGGGGS